MMNMKRALPFSILLAAAMSAQATTYNLSGNASANTQPTTLSVATDWYNHVVVHGGYGLHPYKYGEHGKSRWR